MSPPQHWRDPADSWVQDSQSQSCDASPPTRDSVLLTPALGKDTLFATKIQGRVLAILKGLRYRCFSPKVFFNHFIGQLSLLHHGAPVM